MLPAVQFTPPAVPVTEETRRVGGIPILCQRLQRRLQHCRQYTMRRMHLPLNFDGSRDMVVAVRFETIRRMGEECMVRWREHVTGRFGSVILFRPLTRNGGSLTSTSLHTCGVLRINPSIFLFRGGLLSSSAV